MSLDGLFLETWWKTETCSVSGEHLLCFMNEQRHDVYKQSSSLWTERLADNGKLRERERNNERLN